MDLVAIGFWGAFFGTAGLMLVGALAAFAQADHRVALAAATTAIVSALYAVAYLGWLPIADRTLEARVAAHISIFTGLSLWLMLMTDLGVLREPGSRLRVLTVACSLTPLLLLVAWLLPPRATVVYGAGVALASALAPMPVVARRARRGDRVAWFGVAALGCLIVALAGGLSIALDRAGAPWPVHAMAAVAGICYLACVGLMLWTRYSYLIELREVRVQGPRYDPITRMQANAATGAMVARAFRHQHHPARPVVLIAVSIANLYALENLHGRAALNHALFVCASRLRRCVPPEIEMARLFDDAFLLVARDAGDIGALTKLGRQLASRLAKPLMLRTSRGPGDAERTPSEWAAQLGVGVLATSAAANPAAVVAKVRGLSRTAWSLASRVAWQDDGSEAPVELLPTTVNAGV
jgi:GGDEF domain-containing protein